MFVANLVGIDRVVFSPAMRTYMHFVKNLFEERESETDITTKITK